MFSFTLRCSTSKSFYMQRCEQRCYPQAFRLLSWAYRAGGAEGAAATPPPSLLGKQSQSGNIRFTVGQYWLIIKIKSILWEILSILHVGNMLSNRNFS
jgi:hypothetical protein